jgi:glutathione S-transferase
MPKLYYTPTSCGAASFIAAHTAGLTLDCETVDLASHKTASGADFYAANPKGNVPALVLDDGTCLNEGAAVLQWIADQASMARPLPSAWPTSLPRVFGLDALRARSLARDASRAGARTRRGPRYRPAFCAANVLGRKRHAGHTVQHAANISAFLGRAQARRLRRAARGLALRFPSLAAASPTLRGSCADCALRPQKPESGLAPAPKMTERYLVQAALNWTASELHAACGPLFGPGLSDEVKAFCVDRLKKKYTAMNDLLLKGGKKFLVGDSFTVADSYAYVVCSWAGYIGQDLSAYPNVKAYFDGIAALPNVKAAHAAMAAAPATVC